MTRFDDNPFEGSPGPLTPEEHKKWAEKYFGSSESKPRRSMDLSTPIVSVQDGPRSTMSTGNFGGKKAAPFVKGGGRSKSYPNGAKGKRKAAKAAVKRAHALASLHKGK